MHDVVRLRGEADPAEDEEVGTVAGGTEEDVEAYEPVSKTAAMSLDRSCAIHDMPRELLDKRVVFKVLRRPRHAARAARRDERIDLRVKQDPRETRVRWRFPRAGSRVPAGASTGARRWRWSI